MQVTISTIELIDEASELGQAILQSEVFQYYLQSKNELVADSASQDAIKRFNKVKEQYEDVQRFGKYHPDYKTISSEIRQVKREVDSSPAVISFKKAERELEMLLNEISEIIARAVSDTIKVPTGNPYFDNMACSGGCATGGGCSC